MVTICVSNFFVTIEMNRRRCCVLIFCFFLGCHGLSCRSEGGYKDADLKKMYNTCLMQQNNNSSDDTRQSEDWRDRGHVWNNDHKTGYRDEQAYNRMSNRDRNRDENKERYGMGNRERGETHDINDRYNKMDRRDRNYNMNTKGRDVNGYGGGDQLNGQTDRLNGRDDFLQSEEFGGDNSRSNYYNQYNRRNKRERRVEMNSGRRSQYNPNSHKTKGSENSNDSRNSNSSQAQDKACALHCLMENLHMTGENGMPDRYLITHTITKDVKNEDLRDFLQESIEECFQILDNENTEDKCEFSKNVLLCLSEKGRANCDDWKDEFQF